MKPRDGSEEAGTPRPQGPSPEGGRERRPIFTPPVSEDVRRELAFHIAMKAEELIAEGWSAEAARAEAERCFGDVHAVEEECRDITRRQRRTLDRQARFETLLQDVRFGLRTFVRRPAFTLVAVITLALGVGANAAVFAVVDALLIAPLPYAEADRLVRVWEVGESGSIGALTEPNFRDLRERVRSFEAIATHPTYWFGGATTILGGTEPVQRWTAFVSRDFFRVMAAEAALGRVAQPAEAEPGAPPVAVVSHAFWSRYLDSDAELAARSIEVGSTRYQIVGVMPRGFRYPDRTDVWIPSEPTTDGDRTSHNYAAIARLRDGVSISDAQREVTALMRGLKEEHGERMNAVDGRVVSLRDELYGDFRRPLLLLLAAAGLVLLVACTNLASSWLARASARTREFAIRSSLGAGRGRLVRQLFTESLMLALMGGVAGVLIAMLLLRVLVRVGPPDLGLSGGIGIGGAVVLFTFAISAGAALLFGLLPTLRTTRSDLATSLREGGRTGSEARSRTWDLLVGGEVALAVVLLIAAGLVLRGFDRLLAADPGFDPEGVILAEASVPGSRHPTDTAVAMLHERLIAELSRVPGIESVGLVSHVPFGGLGINGSLVLEARDEPNEYADYRVASAGYFETMRIPLLAGRTFGSGDRIGSPTVAVVNRTFAERFLPDEEVVGRRIRDLANDSWYYGSEEWITIVGVVGDVRHRGYRGRVSPAVYVCSCQRAQRARSAVLVLRTARPQASVVAAARQAIAAVEPAVPVEFSTMRARMSSSVADRRFVLLVITAFAGLALVLAVVGIYGVVSYAVARRTRELGIRLALGAVASGVVGMVVGAIMRVVLVGIASGVLLSFVASRVLIALLPDVVPLDPVTIASVIALLVAMALLASWLPAHRVTRIDPLSTLRSD